MALSIPYIIKGAWLDSLLEWIIQSAKKPC